MAALALSDAGQFVAVHQAFSGDVTGHALLIFPEGASARLVKALVPDLPPHEIAGMADEAISEAGNVVLNGYISTIANMLQVTFKVGLPETVSGEGAALFQRISAAPGEDIVISQEIDFRAKNLDIRGSLAIVTDVSSIARLKQLIGDFLARAFGAGVSFGDR